MMEEQSLCFAGGGALPVMASPRMPAGFRHGFTTRAGGVSARPFDTLNLGWRWGDRCEDVTENHRRLLLAVGARALLRVSQVHGIRILHAHQADDATRLATEEADGLCTDLPGLGLSVHVADCTPILMACPRTGACAALHAGWRGTLSGMARVGVESLVAEFGCQARELRVVLGPCIGPCCFEVGPEVAAAFLAAMPTVREDGVVRSRPAGKAHIDLRLFQRMQLEATGVPSENIDASADCTLCDARGRFFSFRRAGRATGQSVGFIVRQ
jgi:polyphenol oxidase